MLDEATSQIDSESEAAIADTIRQVTGKCTVLVIAHRLATVLDCHRIVVMDHGKVVDSGTHEELLDSCPLYARLTETVAPQAAYEHHRGFHHDELAAFKTNDSSHWPYWCSWPLPCVCCVMPSTDHRRGR